MAKTKAKTKKAAPAQDRTTTAKEYRMWQAEDMVRRKLTQGPDFKREVAKVEKELAKIEKKVKV